MSESLTDSPKPQESGAASEGEAVELVEPLYPEALESPKVEPLYPDAAPAAPAQPAEAPRPAAQSAEQAPKQPSPRAGRTFRERLRRADSQQSVGAAFAWARGEGLQGLEALVAQAFGERSKAAGKSPEAQAEVHAWHRWAQLELLGARPTPTAEASAQAAPSAGAADAQPAAPAVPTYQGVPVPLVQGAAQGALWLVERLAEATRGKTLDLTKGVERTLFRGTPAECTVRGSPVERLTELLAVKLGARAHELGASAAATAAELGEAVMAEAAPGSVFWDTLPFAVALAAAAVPNPLPVAQAVGGAWLRGARGAARAASRLVRGLRRRA